MNDGRAPVSSSRDPLARYAPWGLAGVLLVALGVRLWGSTFGLPYVEHPDEPFWVINILKMLKTADPNPHDFIYPSFYYYLNALAYLVYYGVGRLFGVFHNLTDLAEPALLIGGSGKTTLPALFLIGRSIAIALGIGTVALTVDLGRRFTGFVLGGVLAGLCVALSPTLAANNRYMIPDGTVAFFTTLTLWGAWRIFERGGTKDYLLAGAALGLAVGTKYNAAPFALLIMLAPLLRAGWRGLRDWRPYGALALSAAVFLATTPYALLDFRTFLNGAFIDIRHYAGGHAGNTGNSLAWYLDTFWRTEGPVLVLAAAGIIWGVGRRAKGVILLGVMTLVYLFFIGLFAVHAMRTALPLIPLFGLLAAGWAVDLRAEAVAISSRAWPGAAIALIAIVLAFPLAGTVRDTVRLTRPDSLDTAREWIDANVPSGAHIGVESYSPWIDPRKFVVQGFYKLNDHPPEWYVAEGYDYLVFSQTMFRRFYADPARFAADIARYEAFFRAFEEAKVFTDGGYEVRVYRVPRP
jgi:4-amino-4-deoxy-L-arabinose transferase-like glycosyltransferase